MSTGQIVDLMSNDAQRLMNITGYLHILWSGPFQIIISLLMLWQILGFLATLAGFIVMVILIPLNSYILKKQKTVRTETVKKTDERVKWTNEVMQGIRAVKQYCFELKFVDKIQAIRDLELKNLKVIQLIGAFNSWVFGTSPVLVCVCSLTVYVLLGNPLTADVLFPAVSLFNLLRFPLMMFPSMVTSTAEVWVSIKRLQKFLLCDEMKPLKLMDEIPNTLSGGAPAVIYLNGDFAWEKDDFDTNSNVLKGINLIVPDRSKVGIIGPVGSGKSSLISVLLGELTPSKKDEAVGMQGTISLVPQQPWIMNATVRENILFGKEYDKDKYDNIIEACALIPDFEQLASGDKTEIGEKGINLSGGQKQRISIARALYQDTEVYLLDDPLSAVDAHVAKHIFEKVICGILKDKTVLLVTHYLHLLPNLDHVVSMKDGKIEEQGSYKQLLQDNSNFARLIREYTSQAKEEEEKEHEQEDELDKPLDNNLNQSSEKIETIEKLSDTPKEANASIISKEEREIGSVKPKTILEYGKAAGSYFFLISIITGYALSQLSKIATDWWLSYWSEDPNFENHTFSFYFSLYIAWCIFNSLSTAFAALMTALTAIRCSRSLHTRLLENVIRAPMSFFESTPLGRILNRFAKDMDGVDTSLPSNLASFLRTTMTCFSTLLLICIVTPISIIALIPIMYFYFRIQQFYRASSRELKRLDSISKSPIFAHFSETLAGLSSLRAYRALTRFIGYNEENLDYNNRAYFSMVTANRWLSIRLEFLSTTVLAVCGLLVVLERGYISPSTAGLVLSYAFSVTSWLSWLVRTTADTEQSMNSVERVLHYSQINIEPPLQIDYLDDSLDSWPSEGKVVFNQASLKYRADLSNALDRITLEIKPREKVGICGRTGAGKSSILVALFRLVELHSGSIEIDGVNISEIGLHTLRSRLAIIPQDPVLFTGSIRTNLDPFDQYTDKEIWDALEMVQMKQYVIQLPEQLGYPVTEMGAGFSVGQRQLLSFARALLGKVQLLLLDEATASCDLETDHLIQKTLREKFIDCTVITIAHRLNTIMDSDRILVMSRGSVAEFDHPYTLLCNRESELYKMVQETGDAADHLIDIAKAKYEQSHSIILSSENIPQQKEDNFSEIEM